MKKKRIRFYMRLGILLLLLVAFLFLSGARLYNLQITHGEDNRQQSERRVVRTVSVPAARGEILDRYGRSLVVNQLSYTVRLNFDRLKKADGAEIVSRLIALMNREGIAYEDTFPVTSFPYAYKDNLTDTEQSRLDRFLKKFEIVDMAAFDFIIFLREKYNIDDRFDQQQARDIAAVFYEMELRYQFGSIPPYWFAQDVPLTLVSQIKERNLPGVLVDTVPVRKYSTQFAAHILGRVGPIPEKELDMFIEMGYASDELVGLDGMERSLESWLHGTAGERREETTTDGKVTSILSYKAPEPGDNCLLTIDIRLQEELEYSLEQHILEMRKEDAQNPKAVVQGGAAVAISVKTGEILAMASYPTFSLADFYQNYAAMLQDEERPMLNRAISGTYEPGSTFKMATALAALETDTIKPKTAVVDRGPYMRFAPSYTPACQIWNNSRRTHGSVNVSSALQVSCNYFFFEAGWLTGIEEMNAYAKKLGFGQLTGIDLPGERPGILAGPDYVATLENTRWNAGDVIQAAIGQSYNLFTPLQMATYTATLAAGGVRMRPHLLKAVKSFSYDTTILDIPPEVMEDIAPKEESIRAIQEGMRMAAQPGGTAYSVYANYPVAVAAKTGSAQVVNGIPANGVFVVYAPYEDPEIAIAVVIERGGSGGRVAPITRDLLDAYFATQEKAAHGEEMNRLVS